jgi:hypothetical protein
MKSSHGVGFTLSPRWYQAQKSERLRRALKKGSAGILPAFAGLQPAIISEKIE